MHVPPYYKKPEWQQFLAGAAIGALLGWIVFLFIHGETQDIQASKINHQSAEIRHLKQRIDVMEEDYRTLNETNEKKLKIQQIKVEFTAEAKEKYRSSAHTLHLLRQAAEEELHPLLTKNIEEVAANRTYVIKAIENKTYTIDQRSYHLEVKEMYLYKTLELLLVVSHE
ncbi:sporulation membrane protein YtrI [Aureibacillus halotolerans]|uniref:Sporulation membrane protein YtrI C-terminal domain-containing protein n=1 Tax=Aureibacillus halotolerans TaxID=1508390 RepID=A0A4R6TZR2_9BACI|nr:sporulation membrane protein YtrI [Aureibacillus halotolerans]TDQ39131.1 hypothetical protein EV213_10878 [Aureibacillus halotolerans]